MKTIKIINMALLMFLILLLSCSSKKQFDEKDKIFHAAGANGGIGGIYFSLYKNHKYQVCESGGLGETCYDGDYTLVNDTIILNDLNKECYIRYNRLLICRYNRQDSNYWLWKYPTHTNWMDMKDRDLRMGTVGDIHQINNQNELILDPTYYFVFGVDNLNNSSSKN